MQRPQTAELSPIQQTIVACVQEQPGRYTRSELAKVLVGSPAAPIDEATPPPCFGRLAGRGRKAITFEVDILLQQGYLALDARQKLNATPKG